MSTPAEKSAHKHKVSQWTRTFCFQSVRLSSFVWLLAEDLIGTTTVVCSPRRIRDKQIDHSIQSGESMASVLKRILYSGVRGSIATSPLVRNAASLPENLKKAAIYSEMYPDMLPSTDITKRNYVSERLERADMLKRWLYVYIVHYRVQIHRQSLLNLASFSSTYHIYSTIIYFQYSRRTVLDIPEFYVGSFMSITVTDNNAPGKKNKFVGICTQRYSNDALQSMGVWCEQAVMMRSFYSF